MFRSQYRFAIETRSLPVGIFWISGLSETAVTHLRHLRFSAGLFCCCLDDARAEPGHFPVDLLVYIDQDGEGCRFNLHFFRTSRTRPRGSGVIVGGQVQVNAAQVRCETFHVAFAEVVEVLDRMRARNCEEGFGKGNLLRLLKIIYDMLADNVHSCIQFEAG